MTAGLADALRQGTHSLHTEVERSTFMRTLLRGQMERTSYCLLLRNLHALYAALEAALELAKKLGSAPPTTGSRSVGAAPGTTGAA